MNVTEHHSRETVCGRAVPLRGNDIDTDRIIPARFAKAPSFDALGDGVFADDRQAMVVANQVHPFDDQRFSDGTILLVNENFGCGSSREHAVAALMRWGAGIRAVVGESYSTIFAANCLANGIPAVTADRLTIELLMTGVERDPRRVIRLNVRTLLVAMEGAAAYPVKLAAGPRRQLIDGSWEVITRLLANEVAIRRTAASLPYVAGYRASRT